MWARFQGAGALVTTNLFISRVTPSVSTALLVTLAAVAGMVPHVGANTVNGCGAAETMGFTETSANNLPGVLRYVSPFLMPPANNFDPSHLTGWFDGDVLVTSTVPVTIDGGLISNHGSIHIVAPALTITSTGYVATGSGPSGHWAHATISGASIVFPQNPSIDAQIPGVPIAGSISITVKTLDAQSGSCIATGDGGAGISMSYAASADVAVEVSPVTVGVTAGPTGIEACVTIQVDPCVGPVGAGILSGDLGTGPLGATLTPLVSGHGNDGGSVIIMAATSTNLAGTITSGNGGDGGSITAAIPPTLQPTTVTAADGGNGGGVFLTTQTLTMTGILATGRGGNGGMVQATGVLTDSFAAGNGGHGGDLTFKSAGLNLSGPISTGQGGIGGDATIVGNVGVGLQGPGKTQATAGSGGAGGNVLFPPVTDVSSMSSTLAIGNGGNGGSAVACSPIPTFATSGAGGNSGLPIAGLTSAGGILAIPQIVAHVVAGTGNGGDAGQSVAGCSPPIMTTLCALYQANPIDGCAGQSDLLPRFNSCAAMPPGGDHTNDPVPPALGAGQPGQKGTDGAQGPGGARAVAQGHDGGIGLRNGGRGGDAVAHGQCGAKGGGGGSGGPGGPKDGDTPAGNGGSGGNGGNGGQGGMAFAVAGNGGQGVLLNGGAGGNARATGGAGGPGGVGGSGGDAGQGYDGVAAGGPGGLAGSWGPAPDFGGHVNGASIHRTGVRAYAGAGGTGTVYGGEGGQASAYGISAGTTANGGNGGSGVYAGKGGAAGSTTLTGTNVYAAGGQGGFSIAGWGGNGGSVTVVAGDGASGGNGGTPGSGAAGTWGACAPGGDGGSTARNPGMAGFGPLNGQTYTPTDGHVVQNTAGSGGTGGVENGNSCAGGNAGDDTSEIPPF
jgi:hypothetical protein